MRYRHYGERAAIYLAALEPNRQRQKSHLRAPKLAPRQSHPARLRRCTNIAVMIRTGIRISDAALLSTACLDTAFVRRDLCDERLSDLALRLNLALKPIKDLPIFFR